MPSYGQARGKRAGNAAYAVLSMLTLLGFGALTVDIGYSRMVQAQLQAATDAAAHGAVAYLVPGDATAMNNAKTKAVAIAAANQANGAAVSITTGDVITGVWDGAVFSPSSDPDDVNAIRVQASTNNIAPILGWAAFGVATLSASSQSVAAMGSDGPAGEVDCILPIAIPDCWFDGTHSDSEIMSMTFQFNPAGSDNVAWAVPEEYGSSSASNMRELLEDCGDAGGVRIGDTLDLNNGMINSVFSDVVNMLRNSSEEWDATAWGAQPAQDANSELTGSGEWGNVVSGPVMVFDNPSYSCPSTGGEAFNENGQPIVGFAWGVIYDATDSGGAAGRNLKMMIDMNLVHEVGTDDGGTIETGVVYSQVEMIVR